MIINFDFNNQKSSIYKSISQYLLNRFHNDQGFCVTISLPQHLTPKIFTQCPIVCPITINAKEVITNLPDHTTTPLGTSCLSHLNNNIEFLLNHTSPAKPLVCSENLVHFQNLLNRGNNGAQAFITYMGDINLNTSISWRKDVLILSTCGNVNITQPLKGNNIYILATQGMITLGSQADLNADNGTIMLCAQQGIVYTQSNITCNTLILSHDIAVGTYVHNKIVSAISPRGTDPGDGVAPCGTKKVTLTSCQVLQGGNFGAVTVVGGSDIAIMVAGDVDLELTAEGTQKDLVFNQSITIITPASVYLPQGLVTHSLNTTGLNITITAGGHIIAQGSGINTVNNSGNSGSVALNAVGSIIVSGVGANPAHLYKNYVSGINSWGNPSGNIAVIAGCDIIVSTGYINQNSSATGINSWSYYNGGNILVMARYHIRVNSGNTSASYAVTGINSWGFYNSSSVLIMAGYTITVNSGNLAESYGATGINSWAYVNNSSSVEVIAGFDLSVRSGNGAGEHNATGINSWTANNSSGSVSVITFEKITITSGIANGFSSVSGVNSYGGQLQSVLISTCDKISFNNLTTTDSIRVLGNEVILIGDSIIKDNTSLGTDFSPLSTLIDGTTITTSPVLHLTESSCTSGTDCPLPSSSLPPSLPPSLSPSFSPSTSPSTSPSNPAVSPTPLLRNPCIRVPRNPVRRIR